METEFTNIFTDALEDLNKVGDARLKE